MKKIINEFLKEYFDEHDILISIKNNKDFYKDIDITITTVSKNQQYVCTYYLSLRTGLFKLNGTALYHDIKTINDLVSHLREWKQLR